MEDTIFGKITRGEIPTEFFMKMTTVSPLEISILKRRPMS